MNELRFEVVDRGDGAGGTLGILVDGRDLIDLVREAEKDSAAADAQPELAGGYAGPALWRIPDIRAHLLGRPEPVYLTDGRVELLVCADCGEIGCWPFEVRVDVDDQRVRWSEYRQPHRPHWRYDQLPPFTFDRAQYEATIARLVAEGWSGP